MRNCYELKKYYVTIYICTGSSSTTGRYGALDIIYYRAIYFVKPS